MTSETDVNIDQTTQRNNTEDRNLHTHRPDDGGSMTSETLVNIDQTTQRNNPEDRNLHTHRCENLKAYIYKFIELNFLYRGQCPSNTVIRNLFTPTTLICQRHVTAQYISPQKKEFKAINGHKYVSATIRMQTFENKT
jgi:hypothetical protein